MNKTEDIKNLSKQRISAHSHIKGLGLNDDGSISNVSCGLIGQETARQVCHSLENKFNDLYQYS